MIVTDILHQLVPALQDENLKAVGFDTESSGLNPYEDVLLLIQISTPEDDFVINVGSADKRYLEYALGLIEARNLVTVAHNWKHDAKFIYHNYGILFKNPFDTMIAESLIRAGIAAKFSSLKDISMDYLGIQLDKDVREKFIGKTDFEFSDEELEYSEMDAKILLPLKDKLERKLVEKGQWNTWELEMKLEPVVTLMEYTGIYFDVEGWRSLSIDAVREREKAGMEVKRIMADNFDKLAGKYTNAYEALENMKFSFSKLRKAEKDNLKAITTKDEIKSVVVPMINFGSWRQALHVLHKLGVPTKTTNAKELEWHRRDHPIVEAKLSYAEWDKKATLYGEDFLKHVNPFTSAIHTSLNQTGTATGRFSSDNPNLQNILTDFKYRSKFIARPGYKMGTYDYSQIELRIIGEVSREPRFIEAYQNGWDLHSSTASIVFQKPLEEITKENRKFAKSLNFATVYGTTAKGLAWNFAIPEAEAQEYLDVYFQEHPTLKYFVKKFGNMCMDRGYSVTMGGRRRFLPLPKRANSRSDYKAIYKARRKAVNHLPQGTCGDMIKWDLVFMFYENPFGWENFRPLLTVHDEIVVEMTDDIEEQAGKFARVCMIKAAEIYLKEIPVEVDGIVDTHWRK